MAMTTAMLAGCVSLPSESEVRARAAAYNTCSPGGARMVMTGSLLSGDDADGPLRTKEVTPTDPEWRPPERLSDAVLLDPATWVVALDGDKHHKALRGRLGRAIPGGVRQIRVYSEGGHYGLVRSSVIATQGEDGVWLVDFLTEAGPPRHPEQARIDAGVRAIEGDAARRLNDLISDACLYLEPTRTTTADVLSNAETQWVLEIIGPYGAMSFQGRSSGYGRTGELKRLVTGAEI